MPIFDDVIHQHLARQTATEIVARADKLIRPMIDRHGALDCPEIRATFARFERMEIAARTQSTPAPDDLGALIEATADPIVAPALLDNYRAEGRRLAVTR